jgi:hypothetical protein
MNAARKLANVETYLEAGRVERMADEVIEVRLANGTCRARRAKSCLVAPDLGDRVLCAIATEDAHVLAVLDGREDAPTRLTADGDLQIQSRDGRVTVGGTAGVALVSGSEVSVTAGSVHVRAPKGSIAIDDLGFLGKVVQAQVTKVALVAKEIDTVADRLAQRVKRSFRFVEEMDQTRAGTIDLRAQNLVGIRGENAVISARVLAKVDGEQIHIG